MKLDALRARLREGEVIESPPVAHVPRRFQVVPKGFDQGDSVTFDWTSRYPFADFGILSQVRSGEYGTAGILPDFADFDNRRHHLSFDEGAQRRRECFELTLAHTAFAAYQRRIVVKERDDELWLPPPSALNALAWVMTLTVDCFSTFQITTGSTKPFETWEPAGWKRLIPRLEPNP